MRCIDKLIANLLAGASLLTMPLRGLPTRQTCRPERNTTPPNAVTNLSMKEVYDMAVKVDWKKRFASSR